jgi:hypothetical protein
MKNFLPLLFLFLTACQPEPEKASPLYYITSFNNEVASKLQVNCVFRYSLQNVFNRLDNESQHLAIKTAFDLWQASNPNLRFLRYQASNTEISIRFASKEAITFESLLSPVGLVRGDIATLSATKRENKTYVILLNSDYSWDAPSLTRVLTHQIGIFLGLNASSEINSIMNPVFTKEILVLSKQDSILVNKLYYETCSYLDYSFLPLNFQVNRETPKKIILDRPGSLSIRASGYITVGIWLGGSTPDGLERGLFNFPIDEYNIVPSLNHAALMYRLNNDPTWYFCGSQCDIVPDGINQYLELTFHVNDKNLTDNSGAYNVTVNYK